MYKNKVTGLTEYETFEELLKAEIISFTEDKENYYIRLVPEQTFENTIWVVNKKTKNVSWIAFTVYICNIIDKVTPVDIEKIKKRIA